MKFIKKYFILLFSICFLLSCKNTSTEKTSHQIVYYNPVIPGEIPDPSVIRVGETYYATGTSFDFAPNYPIYKSTDLINWQQIGAVFEKPPKWSSDDFWAPELFYTDSTFFVYYTTKRKDNRIACIGVASTKDISKGFTDHGIIIEWGEEAIDAYVFQDDDGKNYITWKAYGLTEGREVEILASELSKDGLSLVGEHFTLTDYSKGWVGAGDEGQCLVHYNDYYYLLYSVGGCCDNKCDYRVKVARSKNLKSGWEQLPEPILQGGEEWRCPGHGTLVTTSNKRYFYLYHSYNATDFEYIGRQGLLDELIWNEETNWPYFINGNTPSVSAESPFGNTVQLRDTLVQNYFSSENQLSYREWDLHYPRPHLNFKHDTLTIRPTHSGMNFLGFRPGKGDYSFTTKMQLQSTHSGIGIYSNQQKMLAITANQTELQILKIEEGKHEVLSETCLTNETDIYLKYKVERGKYVQFYWSVDGSDWQAILINDDEQLDATYLATWGYSPRAGLIMNGNEKIAFKYSEQNINYYF